MSTIFQPTGGFNENFLISVLAEGVVKLVTTHDLDSEFSVNLCGNLIFPPRLNPLTIHNINRFAFNCRIVRFQGGPEMIVGIKYFLQFSSVANNLTFLCLEPTCKK